MSALWILLPKSRAIDFNRAEDVVPAIEADVNGATTIRQRLEKHRADKTCAECHERDGTPATAAGLPVYAWWRNRSPVAGRGSP